MKFHEYIDKCAVTLSNNPQLRRGQVYFNTLWDVDQDLALEVYMTELDPFYFDSRIPAFLEWIFDRWPKQ